MKAGTTSLHAYLNQHPDIFMSAKKELDFFIDKNFEKMGLDWYKAQFPIDAKVRGESSQNYTKRHHPNYLNVPERIKSTLSDVKLIYIVRDPIERMRSHYIENYYGDDLSTIAFNKSISHYQKTSLYHFQISAYLEYFEKSNLLIVCLEDLKANRLEQMNRIFRFLKVTEMKKESTFDFVSNSYATKEVPMFIRQKFWFRFIHKLNPNFAKGLIENKSVKRLLKVNGVKPDYSREEIERYKELFRPDIKQLKEVAGLTFEKWDL